MVWDKGQPGLGYTIRYSHEDVLVFRKGEPGSRANLDHPHEKPLDVLMRLFGVCCGDTLALDPCMGSGSTIVAAKRLGRRAIGIEIEERYCEIAADRLRREEKPLFSAPPAPDAGLFDVPTPA